MSIASILAFSLVYNYDNIGALRHTNPIMEKCGKKQRRRKGTHRERVGAMEHRRKGWRKLLASGMMVTQKEKMEIEKRWEGM